MDLGALPMVLHLRWWLPWLVATASFAQPQPPSEEPLSPRIANYHIEVIYNAEDQTFQGKQRLLWFNRSDVAVPDLQFHLYLNGFRNSETTFMRSASRSTRYKSSATSTKGWGYIDVARMAVAFDNGSANPLAMDQFTGTMTDITPQLGFLSAQDNNENDRSVLHAPLPEPIPPGSAVWVEIEFHAKFPNPPIARTGAIENYVFAGQWFPKIAVFEEGSWTCHQFHYNSEFYADFGVYDVSVTLPSDWAFGATGQAVSAIEGNDGTITHRYQAKDVHDFAWTASPEYLEYETNSQDVAIRLLLHEDHEAQADRHLTAAADAVRVFQDWYGDYPFPNLTVVDPHPEAMAVGGMEYPTLITAGTTAGLPAGIRVVENVIIHEFGHNYWYHLLASNEAEESWLDEGINTYTDIVVSEELYGTSGNLIDFAGLKLNLDAMHRGEYISLPDADPILLPSWRYYSRSSYGINSYSRPGIVLWTLHKHLGDQTMRAVMREYVRQFRFKHPKTNDFVNVVNQVSGEDWLEFFEQALLTTRVLDYGVDVVISDPAEKPRGYDFGLATASQSSRTASEQSARSAYDNVVKIRRLGDFILPVEIEFTYEDGSQQRKTWDGREQWVHFKFQSPSRLAAVTVDPDKKVVMDVNYTNNSKRVEPKKQAVRRLTLSWLPRVQTILELFGL